MNYCLTNINKEADKIIQKIKSGELMEGCCMSTIQTATTEAWEVAQALAEIDPLSSSDKEDVFSKLDKDVQSQLITTNYDSFDLIYERLLQLINQK
jgi:hypothetical protein